MCIQNLRASTFTPPPLPFLEENGYPLSSFPDEKLDITPDAILSVPQCRIWIAPKPIAQVEAKV